MLDKTLPHNTYFSRDKYLNNYEMLFQPNDMKYYQNTIRGGAFNREAYKTNEQRRSLANQRTMLLKPYTHIWDIPFRYEEIEEDNDTEEEESESDSEDGGSGSGSSQKAQAAGEKA